MPVEPQELLLCHDRRRQMLVLDADICHDSRGAHAVSKLFRQVLRDLPGTLRKRVARAPHLLGALLSQRAESAGKLLCLGQEARLLEPERESVVSLHLLGGRYEKEHGDLLRFGACPLQSILGAPPAHKRRDASCSMSCSSSPRFLPIPET